MQNPKTTIAGILTILVAVALAVKGVLTGTSVDWSATVTAILAALAGLGLWGAKDGGT